MPGPAIAAVAGGLGSALIGAHASRSAAKSQARSSGDQLRLQADMFNRMDDLQSKMFRGQAGTINENDTNIRRAIGSGYRNALDTASDFRDQSIAGSRNTMHQNEAINQNALTEGGRLAYNTQRGSINDANRAFNRGEDRAEEARNRNTFDFRHEMRSGTHRVTDARDRNLGQMRREMRGGTQRLMNDRDANITNYRADEAKSLGYFEPSIARGDSAGGAYAYNLGLGGKKPSDYTGLKESAGTKYLMKTGRREIEGGAAGRGNLNSGATLAALEEKRQGLASLDKDNQMAQLMAMAGLGQNAANSAAAVRANYSDDIAGQRTGATSGINALRAGYTGSMAGERTGAANNINTLRAGYTNAIAGERGDYRDSVNNLDTTRTNQSMAARNLGTSQRLGLLDQFAGRGMNINDTFNANRTSALGGYANMATSAGNNRTAGLTNQYNNLIANLGAARSNRANLYGTSAMNYANQASNAYGAMGDAHAAGAVGSANALLGGINNGVGIFGMMNNGGGGGAVTPQVPSSGTNVFAHNANPFANIFGGMFGK